jgi:hypothetical protein
MCEHGVTLHGFRSTLSTTWAEEQDDGRTYPHAVMKAVLAMQGDAVTAACLRSQPFEARRKVMEHRSRFAMSVEWMSLVSKESFSLFSSAIVPLGSAPHRWPHHSGTSARSLRTRGRRSTALDRAGIRFCRLPSLPKLAELAAL